VPLPRGPPHYLARHETQMKIIVLDGFTLNPGDLSWNELKSLGECEIHDRSSAPDVVRRAADAEIILTNKTVLNREQIFLLPKLKYIGVLATGYNIVDVAAARDRNIPVTNVPTYGTRSVAQHTFALLLELAQHAGHHAQTVRDGRWTKSPDFCYWDYPLVELDGLTMGIVGLGRIGKAVAGLAAAFGMSVLAASSATTSRNPMRRTRNVVASKRRRQPALPAHGANPEPGEQGDLGSAQADGVPAEHEPRAINRRTRFGRGVEYRSDRRRRGGRVVGRTTSSR